MNQKGSVVLFVLILILGIAIGAIGWSMYSNSSHTEINPPTQPNPSPQVAQATTQPSAQPSNSNLVTFHDTQIAGFGFSYDPQIWTIETNEDVKGCGDNGCGPAYGREVIVTDKRYPDFPHKLSLTISLFDADQYATLSQPTPLCFNQADLIKIDNNWYRAKTPFETDSSQDLYKIWDRYYYQSSTMKVINGQQCIVGGLNFAEQANLPVKFEGKPTMLDVELRNGVSAESVSSADEMVKSIRFQ